MNKMQLDMSSKKFKKIGFRNCCSGQWIKRSNFRNCPETRSHSLKESRRGYGWACLKAIDHLSKSNLKPI